METLDASRNLAHQVTHALGRAIVQGKYAGDHIVITEAELSDQFKISRTVTREAVKMLSAKGLLSSRQRRGITVASCDQWNMFDEDVLSWTLSTTPTLQLLKEFAIEVAAQDMAIAEDIGDDIYEADIAFHTAIFAATRNRFFIQFRSFIRAALRASVVWHFRIKDPSSGAADDHLAVFKCIHAHDAEGASRAMRQMLEKNIVLIEAALAREQNLVKS